MALSKQTPIERGFPYMPLHDATLLIWPTDRDQPRVFILKSSPQEPFNAFAYGKESLIRAMADPTTLQVRVWVGDKEAKTFSIKYPGRVRKKSFQRT
jgi:hypothetical protein